MVFESLRGRINLRPRPCALRVLFCGLIDWFKVSFETFRFLDVLFRIFLYYFETLRIFSFYFEMISDASTHDVHVTNVLFHFVRLISYRKHSPLI